jgi:hypothetical protein
MGKAHDNEKREKKRVAFARARNKERSIAESCKAAGISVATYYAWNENDDWKKGDGWSKSDGDSKT